MKKISPNSSPTTSIVWHGIKSSRGLEATIRAEVASLAALWPAMRQCRVVVEQPHQHHRHGRHYQVKVELHVLGRGLAASREPSKDLWRAIEDSFAAMRRQLTGCIARHRELPRRGGTSKKRALASLLDASVPHAEPQWIFDAPPK